MNYVLFDDYKSENFYPLTLNRSSGDLRVGILKLRQRIAAYFGFDEYAIVVSKFLQELYRERHLDRVTNHLKEGETIFVNNRLKINDEWVKNISNMPVGSLYTDGECVIAARCVVAKREINSEELPELFAGLKEIKVEKNNSCWNYIWELIIENAAYIQQDFEDFFQDEDNLYQIEPGVTILNPYNVWIGEGVVLKPGAVIDASEGAVVLDEGSHVMSNAVLIGPIYVGKNSVVKAAAKIYEGTSIGPVCKIGGEVESTIFQAYTNKQHDGFLGHSYLGEWVNLGANTNNSDLKNNYKPVSVYFYPGKTKINTNSLFVGSIIGDHTKTAINSLINTGTVIGVGCNLFGNNIIKDYISSFSWGIHSDNNEMKDQIIKHRLDAFLETAGTVKERRKLILSEAEIKIYKQLSTTQK